MIKVKVLYDRVMMVNPKSVSAAWEDWDYDGEKDHSGVRFLIHGYGIPFFSPGMTLGEFYERLSIQFTP